MSLNQLPSVVVFDLGGVLIDWNPCYLYRSVFNDNEEEMEWFLENVCPQSWNRLQDGGRPFAEAIAERIQLFPAFERQIRTYFDEWETMLGGPIQPAVDVLQLVKNAGYPLYAITNWSGETFPIARRRFEFLNWFRGIVVSGEIEKLKPDPAIFNHLFTTFELAPEDCVFIDDVEENVRGARAVGMFGIHFRSAKQLRDDMENIGFRFSNNKRKE